MNLMTKTNIIAEQEQEIIITREFDAPYLM